jgi:hypothetical protein
MRVALPFLLVLLLGAPLPVAAAPDETGPLVIDEVFLGAYNGTSFLNGVQWVEFVNAGSLPVDVAGLRLVAVDHPALALKADAPIPAGGTFVLLVTADEGLALAAQAALPPGLPLQVLLAGPLPDAPSSLSVESDDAVLDWLPIGQALEAIDLPGAAFALDPEFLSVEGNNDPSHWCASVEKTSLLGHLVNGTPGETNASCDFDGDGYSKADGDCSDDSAAAFPGGVEVCDGQDNDCNGTVDDVAWLDGTAATTCLQAGACFGTLPSCVDGEWRCAYPADYEEVEATCDAIDNDCDGQTDDGLTNACGLCGALAAESCDGLDNDCDGVADEGVQAPDGICSLSEGVCVDALPACAGIHGWRCDYGPAYEETETLCDGLDNDCDGNADESYPLGALCVVDVRSCQATGVWACSGDHHGVTCVAPAIGQGGELCGDGVDNDCDGETDEDYPVGAACEVGTGGCRVTGRFTCTDDDLGVVCDATPLQPSTEECDDGADNDCDGQTDELDCVAAVPDENTTITGGAVRCDVGSAPSSLASVAVLFGLGLAVLGGARRRYGVR